MTFALVLVALACWLSTGRRRRPPIGPGSWRDPGDPIGLTGLTGSVSSVRPRRHASSHAAAGSIVGPTLGRAAPALAGAASACGCLAVAGWPGGAFVGAVVAPGAVIFVRWLQSRASPGLAGADRAWIPLSLDLVATALLAGQPLPAALVVAAPRARPAVAALFDQAGGMLRLGAQPVDAWRAFAADPQLRPVAVTAVRTAASGIKLAAALRELAGDLRAEARVLAHARAERAGVWAIAPLGLCFLPAFVCVGIVPVVIGVATGLLHSTLI
jgi:Flp pilus assembly protein TadB